MVDLRKCDRTKLAHNEEAANFNGLKDVFIEHLLFTTCFVIGAL